MRKKKIALLFWFIVLACAICIGLMYLKEMNKRWFKDVEISEYGLTISYPNSYVDIPIEKDNIPDTSVSTSLIFENIQNKHYL